HPLRMPQTAAAEAVKTIKSGSGGSSNSSGGGGGNANAGAGGVSQSTVEHSATVDNKSLKMKIKRTKSGSKSSEAKHEIVKSNEQNGADASAAICNNTDVKGSGSSSGKHSIGTGGRFRSGCE
ncbi:hypothetical protein U1Q18_049735, partial [Sarracenia purpurea var. burkii]